MRLSAALDDQLTSATEGRTDADAVEHSLVAGRTPLACGLLRTGWRRLIGQTGGLRHQLATAMIGTFALNVASKVLMLGVTVLLARYMGPHEYGIYASALAALTLVGALASLGLPNLIVREVAAFQLHEQWGQMRGLLSRSLQFGLFVCVVLGVALYVEQDRLAANGEYSQTLLWITFALLPLTLLGAMRNSTLRGLHHVVLGLLPEWLIVPVIFIAIVIVMHVLAPTMLSPPVVMSLRLAAVAVGFIVGVVALWHRLPRQLFRVAPAYHTATWLRAALPMLWVGAMSIITTQTDVLMLAAVKGPSDAGIYQVAARGAELVAFISSISAIALQPTISRLYANGELARLKYIAGYAARIMVAAALAVAACYFILGGTLLRFVFGPAFQAAAQALNVLSAGWVIVAAMGPARDTLLMSGGERQSAIAISLAAILNVFLNLLLIPRFGITGAALATAVSLIVCHVGYTLFVRRRLGFWVSPL